MVKVTLISNAIIGSDLKNMRKNASFYILNEYFFFVYFNLVHILIPIKIAKSKHELSPIISVFGINLSLFPTSLIDRCVLKNYIHVSLSQNLSKNSYFF